MLNDPDGIALLLIMGSLGAIALAIALAIDKWRKRERRRWVRAVRKKERARKAQARAIANRCWRGHNDKS